MPWRTPFHAPVAAEAEQTPNRARPEPQLATNDAAGGCRLEALFCEPEGTDQELDGIRRVVVLQYGNDVGFHAGILAIAVCEVL